jgi:hypothetical protein
MTWIISRAMMKAYENSPCSQGLVEEYWEENYSDGERFAPLNVIVTPHPFWLRDKTTDILSHSRFSQMSASLTESLGEDVLMWCQEASRAKTSVLPEKAQESEESEVDFGGRWRGLSVKYDPATSGWKTHHCLFPEDLDWSCLTLPKWGMMSGGELWERTTQEPDTSGIGAGSGESWPTPNVRDCLSGESNTSPEYWQNMADKCKERGINKQYPLRVAVNDERRTWPTPTANEDAAGTPDGKMQWMLTQAAKSGCATRKEYQSWPTPNASDYKGSGTEGPLRDRLDYATERGATKSNTYPKNWATPQARDHRTGGADRWENPERSRNFNDQAATLGNGGQLNPDWVEWLMGWPVAWTQLEGLEQMDWRDWSVDPADGLPPDMLGTPRATEAVRSSEFIKGRTPTPEEYIIATDRLQGGDVPRIATDIPNRIDRLRAIGNGQVPQAMVLAWNELTTNKEK